VLGGERGWFDSLPPALLRVSRRLVLALLAGLVLVILLVVACGDPRALLGGGTWPSLAVAAMEGVLLVSLSLWLLDVFRRRYDHQGRLAQGMSSAAYVAFVIHQIVLVGLVLAMHEVSWPSAVDFLAVAVLGVAVSFGLGALVLRLPGVRSEVGGAADMGIADGGKSPRGFAYLPIPERMSLRKKVQPNPCPRDQHADPSRPRSHDASEHLAWGGNQHLGTGAEKTEEHTARQEQQVANGS